MSNVRNIGDYRIFKGQENPAPQKDKANARGLEFTVHGETGGYEGDAIHVDEEGERTGKQFGYYWLDDPEVDFNDAYRWQYDTMLDDGYRVVKAYRAGEGKPGEGIEWRVNKWRVRPDGRVTRAGKILMAIPAELLDERDEENSNTRAIRESLDAQAAPIHQIAQDAGLGSYVTRGGQKQEVVRARK